jgi:hypothetical protein
MLRAPLPLRTGNRIGFHRTVLCLRLRAQQGGKLTMPYSDSHKARDYQRDYRRLQRAAGCTGECTTPVPLAFRLQTAQDVIDLLQEQVEAGRSEKEAGALEKARTIGYLASVALRAIDAGNLAARIEMLEMVLKRRNGDGKR